MTATHICKNCGHQFSGNFCNQCGEKVYTEKDKNLLHFVEEGFHFLTHFEGKFFTSLKAIFLRPGQLSLDFSNGIRKKYFKPLSFFLLLVVLYLIFPTFQGLNMRLQFHVQHDIYGAYAYKKVTQLMAEKQLSEEELVRLYTYKSEKTSKFLLFLLVPAMALISWGLGFWKRKLFFDHFVFAIEVLCFLIMWGFLILPLLIFIPRALNLIPAVTEKSEVVLGICILTVLLAFITAAARRFFKFNWAYSILYALLSIVLLGAFIQFVYKFILFYITINQI